MLWLSGGNNGSLLQISFLLIEIQVKNIIDVPWKNPVTSVCVGGGGSVQSFQNIILKTRERY